jgi:gliding motility-associated-like protein
MLIRICFIFISFIVFQPNINATHIVGGELNYLRINDSTYQFTLNAYRDCFLGVPLFDNPALFNVFDGNNNFIRRVNVQRPPWDTLPVELTDPCLVVPPNVCVERVKYVFTLVLPPNESGYQVAYQRCCRNATILNIFDDKEDTPESSGATYYAFVPPVSQFRNSNPVFSNFPPVAICANRRLEFDHSATDPDGDSLVYKLCTPFDGLSPTAPTIAFLLESPPYDSIRWRAPYSVFDMLSGPEPLKVDPVSGLLTAIPGRVGQFVVGVCVEEYRDGAFISETRRDFQFNVADCALVTRALFRSVDTSCNNRTINFTNQSTNGISFSWDFGDSNLSSDINPTHTYTEYGTYVVTLITNPGSECVDTFRKTIYITEDNLLIEAPDVTACAGSIATLTLNASNGSLAQVKWIFGADTILSTGSTLQIPAILGQEVSFIASSTEGCTYSGSLTLSVLPAPVAIASADPDVIIRGESTTLTVAEVQGVTYSWQPASSLSAPNLPGTLATPTQSQWYYVTLTDSETGCTATDSVFIKVLECSDTLKASIGILTTGFCSNEAYAFAGVSAVEDVAFFWDFGDGSVAEGAFVEHVYNTAGSYRVTMIAVKENLCSDTVQIEITIESPNLQYQTSPYSACIGSTVLVDLSIESDEPYQVVWSVLPDQVLTMDTLSLTVTESGLIYFSITTLSGCTFRDSVNVLALINAVSASVDKPVISPGETVQLDAEPVTGNKFLWTPQQLVSNPTISNPTATLSETTTFIVTATDTNGCLAIDSVTVVVETEFLCNDDYVFIPSAFSPNGDGRNDTWRVRSEVVEDISISVYNRWGELVFEGDQLDVFWDGTFKGAPASADVYGYYVRARCIGGEVLERKGNLTLIR